MSVLVFPCTFMRFVYMCECLHICGCMCMQVHMCRCLMLTSDFSQFMQLLYCSCVSHWSMSSLSSLASQLGLSMSVLSLILGNLSYRHNKMPISLSCGSWPSNIFTSCTNYSRHVIITFPFCHWFLVGQYHVCATTFLKSDTFLNFEPYMGRQSFCLFSTVVFTVLFLVPLGAEE